MISPRGLGLPGERLLTAYHQVLYNSYSCPQAAKPQVATFFFLTTFVCNSRGCPRETHLSAQSALASEDSWISGPHGHEQRGQGHQTASCQRPEASFGLAPYLRLEAAFRSKRSPAVTVYRADCPGANGTSFSRYGWIEPFQVAR